MIENENIKTLVKKFYEQKLAHVFLIETNDKKALLKDILAFVKILNCPEEYEPTCKKCNLCHLLNTDSLPSLKIIFPDGQAIKKEQMEDLKSAFSTVPYLTRYNCYIINDAEKFNNSSANTMLKFIEEPEENIVGFLITNNKENVIHTIKSRCEIIKAQYETKASQLIKMEIKELAEQYLYKLEVEKSKSILYNKIILDEKLEKEDLCSIFQTILSIYLQRLHGITLENNLTKLNLLSQENIIKRIYLVNEIIERLNYNVNVNLLLDYFALSLEG